MKLLLTDADVMEILSLSERAVKRLRRSGQLPSVTVEGHRRYRRQDVEAFVSRLGTPAATAEVWTIRRAATNPRAKAKAASA